MTDDCLLQVIAGLRSDKDALETALYEQQQVNSNLETRKEQLEGENQELIVKKESLQSKLFYFGKKHYTEAS